MLRESLDGETGFEAFYFQDFLDHHDGERISGGWNESGKAYIHFERCDERKRTYLGCVATAVESFLAQQGLSLEEIDVLLPPQLCQPFVGAVADKLGCDDARTVCVANGLDYASSSVPAAYLAARETGKAKPGDLGLFLSVGAGIQVGCALYRF